MKPLVLRKRDDHSMQITLMQYQDPATLPYFFGYLKGWHLPAVFVRSVWEVVPELKSSNQAEGMNGPETEAVGAAPETEVGGARPGTAT